jgi:hypothetical protein
MATGISCPVRILRSEEIPEACGFSRHYFITNALNSGLIRYLPC